MADRETEDPRLVRFRKMSRPVRVVYARPRTFISIATGIVLFFLLPGSLRLVTRLLIGWDIFAGLYLVLVITMILRSGLAHIRRNAALQDDGRLTNQQLADLVGLSASQCSRRRMRLEEEKVIAGYHADLASEALGFNLIAFIHITLATHSPDNAKKFRALVNRVDDIQEAYSLTGDADYVLKAVLRDLKSLSDIVNNVLMPHPSVAHVRSSIVLDRLKESAKLPLKELAR